MKEFNYDLNYRRLNLRQNPELYRVGRGEQGVLLVEPYKSEILPLWKFKNPELARVSSASILEMFYDYKEENDFVGMDMARKFLQMGFTRARRYANHPSGKKYDKNHEVIPLGEQDLVKAASARIFKKAWEQVEADPDYAIHKQVHKALFG